ncbi:MAG: NTP transferase domain-containing protein [Candidatus Bathyarchaeota archaeon]|nr:NTP transferase domain-containing protein [Candidatus Bathyarchaeota archaeon]
MLPVVIIAGGTASRLEPYSGETHKCLMELEPNVTVLDFILNRIEKITSPRILIVIKPQFKNIFEKRLKGKAELIETDVEEFGNLYSVSLAMKRLGASPFLLLMSDHVFERSILDRVLSLKSQATFTVCLDKKPSRAEAREGLKLALKDEAVVNADKTTLPQHGIDTGMILCREDSKAYVERAIENFGFKATIADALNLAAADGKVDCVDVTGKLWKDVDTPEDLVAARKVYWQILRKELTKPEDGLVSRYLNRPISTRISIMAYRRGFRIEPLTVTLVSFILGLLASLLLAMRAFILGGLLVQAASIIDGVDGEVARLYHKATPWGGYLDSVLDRVSDIAIVAGLTLSLPIIDDFTLLFAILAAANVIFVSYATHNLSSLGVGTERLRKVPATRDVRLFVVFIASLLSLPILGLYYLAVVPIFYLCYSLALAYRMRRGQIKVERVRREPKPEVLIERKEISSKIESLISNSIKLDLSLLVINMIAPAVSGITLISLNGLALSSDHLLTTLNLMVVIYFGYRIMMALKAVIDIIAKRLVGVVGVTETTLKHMLVDCLYIVLTALLWVYLPPQLNTYVGEWASRVAALIIFAFFLLILYDLAKLLYRTFGDFYKGIVGKIAKKLHEDSQ